MTPKNKYLTSRLRQTIIRFGPSFLFYFGFAKISHRWLKDKSRFRLDLTNEVSHIVTHCFRNCLKIIPFHRHILNVFHRTQSKTDIEKFYISSQQKARFN